MKQYLDLLKEVRDTGLVKGDRTGTGTISVFGPQMSFDLLAGFPLLTTKNLNFNAIKHELLWFLRGDTNIKYLNDNKVHIWDEWADENGDLGPIYGEQWVSQKAYELLSYEDYTYHEEGARTYQNAKVRERGINQIEEAINTLQTNPDSRRIVVSAWNPSVAPIESVSPQENVKSGRQALPPCHTLFQFYSQELTTEQRWEWFKHHGFEEAVEKDVHVKTDPKEYTLGKCMVPLRGLSCKMYQRSADLFIGVPYNIASYALMTHIISYLTNHVPLKLITTFGDVHIYKNHFDQVDLQLARSPSVLPNLILKDFNSYDTITADDIVLTSYEASPHIAAPISV